VDLHVQPSDTKFQYMKRKGIKAVEANKFSGLSFTALSVNKIPRYWFVGIEFSGDRHIGAISGAGTSDHVDRSRPPILYTRNIHATR